MTISTQLPEATQQDSLRDFQRIPGIGPSMADDLWLLGYRSVAELRSYRARSRRRCTSACAS